MLLFVTLMKKTNKGFTLIELLLYISLIGLVVLSTMVFLLVLSRQRIRSLVIAEVESQGVGAMQVITQTIRNAEVINLPAQGVNGTAVSVNVPTGVQSPTVFSSSGNILTMVEGANPVVNLTSNRVIVSGLSFHNLTKTGSFGTVRIQFTVSYNNPGSQSEYTYSKTFISNASLR